MDAPKKPRGYNLQQRRFIVYKVLSYSLYALGEYISRRVEADGSTTVSIRTGDFARAMCTRITRFGETLKWLADNGMIRDLERGLGWATYSIPPPTSWNHLDMGDLPEEQGGRRA